MKTLIAAGHSTEVIPLEFFWIIEDGQYTRFVGLESEEFACRSRACAPPPIGTGGSEDGPGSSSSGSGGTDSSGVPAHPRMSSETTAALFSSIEEDGSTKKVQKGKVQYDNGTLSVEGLNKDGSFIEYDAEFEADIAARWKEMGVTPEQLTNNLIHTAEIAMGLDPATGKFDPAGVAQGKEIAAWYTTQGERLKALSEETNMDLDRVVAAATTLSAGRLWDGVANGNYETAERLIGILQKNDPIEVDQSVIDFQKWRLDRATKKTSRIGFDADLEAGKQVRPSDLDSAQLVELLYAKNALRGYNSFDAWAADSEFGKKTPRGHVIKGSPEPPYPLFTSKGTNQVQQAVAVLRGDVSVRAAISGPKYSSFFSNLRRPDLDYSSTNDTWHYRAMAGNLVMNPMVKKNKVGPGTIRELTVKDFAKYDTVLTAQDQFQTGLGKAKYGLQSGDAMFRESTRITRNALNTVKERHPDVFGDMKIHEMQALVWVYYGGGVSSGSTRQSNWDRALSTLPLTGES